MRIFISCLILLSTLAAQAQTGSSFALNIVTDSVLMGHTLTARFVLTISESGTEEELQFPDFGDFYLTNGPTNFQTNIINGYMTQVKNYTFYLEPKEVGDAYIAPASVKLGDAYLETAPVQIRVYPNPDNIPQQQPQLGGSPWGDNSFGQDFLGNDGMNFDFFGQDFQRIDSLSESFFRQFFEGDLQGFDFGLPPSEDTEQPRTKKRKTTRI